MTVPGTSITVSVVSATVARYAFQPRPAPTMRTPSVAAANSGPDTAIAAPEASSSPARSSSGPIRSSRASTDATSAPQDSASRNVASTSAYVCTEFGSTCEKSRVHSTSTLRVAVPDASAITQTMRTEDRAGRAMDGASPAVWTERGTAWARGISRLASISATTPTVRSTSTASR